MSLTQDSQTATVRLDHHVVSRLHPWRWLSALAGVLILILVLRSWYRNPAIDHATIGRYLPASAILIGVRTTIILALISEVIGIIGGSLLALMRLSRNPILRAVAAAYIWLMRGTPLLVQILIWGNLALFYKNLRVGIPFTHVVFFQGSTNSIITTFVASILALSLNEAAYMCEIVRSGLLAVDSGQREAALALGMSEAQSTRRIMLPQAVRVVIPPTGNQFLNMLKMTSLVSVIAGGDLLTQAENISAANLRTVELLVVASIWYLMMTTVVTILQVVLERRMARGTRISMSRRRQRRITLSRSGAGEL